MNIKETAVLMDAIRLCYPRTFYTKDEDLKKTVALWAALFADTPYSVVNAAVKSFIKTDATGFPPTIGQINEQIGKAKAAQLPTESEAWCLVREAISNGTYHSREEFAKLPELCRKIVGSPAYIYELAQSDRYAIGQAQRAFCKAYSQELDAIRYGAGVDEALQQALLGGQEQGQQKLLK